MKKRQCQQRSCFVFVLTLSFIIIGICSSLIKLQEQLCKVFWQHKVHPHRPRFQTSRQSRQIKALCTVFFDSFVLREFIYGYLNSAKYSTDELFLKTIDGQNASAAIYSWPVCHATALVYVLLSCWWLRCANKKLCWKVQTFHLSSFNI